MSYLYNKSEVNKIRKTREELNRKRYLGEIIQEEKPKFGKSNLILAPVGSGKSYLIEKQLIPKNFKGKALYLTSNTALKDSLCPDDNELRKKNASEGKSVRFFTSSNKSKFGDKPYSVHVMTYYEFGTKVKMPHETFTDDFEIIFCDEIHSLPKYLSYKNSFELGIALYWLTQERENKTIYYFTATKESIDELEKQTPGYFQKAKVFNYLDRPDIRRYIANSTYYINHISQLRPHLRARLESFNYYGYKALAFTRLVGEQEKIKDIAELEGFKPIVLWSINRPEKMNEEQLRVRDILLRTGFIPEPYNMLIINGSMQEGWNLYDDKVTLAILDTLDVTEQVQALGRIRHDVDFLIKKTKDENAGKFIEIPDSYINTPLTSQDKVTLCEELYILDGKGRLRKWPTIRKYLIESDYEVEDKTIEIDGKRTRVSIITLDDKDNIRR